MSNASRYNACYEIFFQKNRLTNTLHMVFLLILGSILAGLVGLVVYIYFLKKGQFEDPESVKYQLFREEHPDS